MKKFIVLIVVCFLFSAMIVRAEGEKKTVKVKLSVVSEINIRNYLIGCLTRELKKLDVVDIVGKDANWELKIIARRPPLRGGFIQDWAVSYVILRHIPNQPNIFRGHHLLSGYPNKQDACEEIAITFAEKYLDIKKARDKIERFRFR